MVKIGMAKFYPGKGASLANQRSATRAGRAGLSEVAMPLNQSTEPKNQPSQSPGLVTRLSTPRGPQ